MGDAIIQVKKVSVMYAGDFWALRNVSVDLLRGKVIGFIGPSGAGKTTLIRGIVGRQRLHAGSITVDGLRAGSAALRSQMSYMTQDVSVYNDLTAAENIRYFATMFGVRRQQLRTTVQDILRTVDLTPFGGHLVRKLSGGQKQRVSLAIALIGFPKIMVLDEPTVGLDPVLRETLWQLFRELAQKGTTLIISSHVMDEAERCDDLVLMRDGGILAHGSPADLCRQTRTHSVEQSFLKLVEEKP